MKNFLTIMILFSGCVDEPSSPPAPTHVSVCNAEHYGATRANAIRVRDSWGSPFVTLHERCVPLFDTIAGDPYAFEWVLAEPKF